MLTGQLPFCDTNAIILEHNIKNCGLLYPKGISKGAELIMRRESVINIKIEALKVL
jgi:hypothetical protein